MLLTHQTEWKPVKIPCGSCQFAAILIIQGRAFCYFCGRQFIFDAVRNAHDIQFTNGREMSGLKVIDFTTKKGKAKC